MVKISLSQLEPNKWNANEVTGDTYAHLVSDMRDHGQREPITVSPYPIFYPAGYSNPEHPYTTPEEWDGLYVICDGEHRYWASQELDWKELEATVEELTEDQAITRFYRQQATRGTMNPLKEAALFSHEVQDNGLTEDQVAEKYNATRQYVSGRRMLLNVSPMVRELYERPEEKARELKLKEVEALPPKEEYVKEHAVPWMDKEEVGEQYDELREEKLEEAKEFAPRGALTTGHMRAISSLPEKKQEEIALDVLEKGLTVRDVEEKVRREKEAEETRKKVTKALLKAKRKTCPKCGSMPYPDRFGYNGEHTFVCSECRHTWDYTKTQAEKDAEKKAEQDEETRERVEKMQKGRENPGFIRHIQPYEELYERVAAWTLTKLGELTKVSSVKVKGMTGDRLVELELDPQTMSTGADLSYTVARAEPIDHPGARGALDVRDKRGFGFHMEPKDYKRSGEKTRIDLGWQAKPTEESREQLRAFLDDIVYTNLEPWDKVEAKAEPQEMVTEPAAEPEEAPDYSPGVVECPRCHKTVPMTPYCINCAAPLPKPRAKGITEELFGEEDPRPMGELCDGCEEECDECPHEDQETDEELESPEEEAHRDEIAQAENVEGSDGTLEAANKAINEALGIPPLPFALLDEKAYRNETTEPKAAPKRGKTRYTIKVEEFEEADYARQEGGCRFGYSYDTGQGGGAGSIRDREGFKNTVERMVSEIWKVSKEMKSYPKPTMKNTRVEVCQAAVEEGLITEAEIWEALLTYPIPKEEAPEAAKEAQA